MVEDAAHQQHHGGHASVQKQQQAPTAVSRPAKSEAFTPALSRAFKERLRPCLNALDALRTQGLQQEISLPAIAVVGDQSVGKSSVLEAISGVEFPRGIGIVTRCPLMLKMRSKDDSGWSAIVKYETKGGDWRERKLTSPKEMGAAIAEAQTEMTDGFGEISDQLIEAIIEGPDVPDLTLIDLPGIARYSAELGGSVASITKSLILSYIEKPEVIILAVVPCHVDIETVEALSLAKEIDPESSRTIGVLTCPDLVNPGSEPEVMAMMRNQKIVLKKGYVAVRCRTPQQLKDNVSLQQAYKEEELFFKTHRYFRGLDEYEYGSRTLAVKLSSELFESIRTNVPDMLKEIQVKREEYVTELLKIGEGPPQDEEKMKELLAKLITEFTTKFRNVATGEHRHERDRLFGRCRVHWEQMADAIEDCAFSERTEVKEMWRRARQAIEEQRGCELPGFDNIFPVLERIVREDFLEMAFEPCSTLLVASNQEVDETIRTLADDVFADYPIIKQHVKEVSEGIRTSLVAKARKQIKKIFEEEKYVFTQDRIFIHEKEIPSNEKLCMTRHREESGVGPGGHNGDVLSRNAERVIEGVEAYVRVSVRRLQDTVTMAVMHFLLYDMADGLGKRLVTMLMDPAPLFGKLHEENPIISARRRHLKERIEKLAHAEQELSKL